MKNKLTNSIGKILSYCTGFALIYTVVPNKGPKEALVIMGGSMLFIFGTIFFQDKNEY